MERTKGASQEVRTDGRIRWVKEGRGVFRLKNHIYRPGEIFWARPDEISPQFRDLVRPVDAAELETVVSNPVPEVLVVKPAYTMKKRETSEFWDIFDSQGKQVNEKALRREVAEDYLKSLAK